MLQTNVITSNGPVQSGAPQNRRPDADFDRLIDIIRGVFSAMTGRVDRFTPTELKVYYYLVERCYVRPLWFGESDKVETARCNFAEIGRICRIDRSDARRAIQTLISKGFVREKGGRAWPVRAKFVELVGDRSVDPVLRVVNPLREGRETPPVAGEIPPVTEGNSPIGRGEIPPAPCREPAPSCEGAPARSRSGINSEKKENKDRTENIYHPENPEKQTPCQEARQDDIDRPPDRFPLSSEDSAWLQAFCDRHWPCKHVAEQLCSQRIAMAYEFSWVKKALKRAQLCRTPRWAYIGAILDTWAFKGAPDPGNEDRFDDEMNPIPMPRGPEIIPIETAPAARRFPMSRAERAEADYQKSKAMMAAGISPTFGIPYSEMKDES